MRSTQDQTAAERLLRLAARVGATHIFANLGSDHPAFIQAFAKLDQSGESHPRIVICPHEMTALSAAHGYAMITRQPQLVLVHVDVGTANLGGSVHNAARGRVPAILLAGLSPITDTGKRTGSRTEFIHYIQDTRHQDAIVQPYVKWSYELRAGEMADKILLRGRQLAMSEPQGVVYITGAREVWEESPRDEEPPAQWPLPEPNGIPESAAQEIMTALLEAKRPLILTSYVGRNPESVEKLAALSDRVGIGVSEIIPQYLNFPGDHPHHLGYEMNRFVDQADCIFLFDIDVPWIISRVQPRHDARIFQIDCDPLKESLGYWHFRISRSWRADTGRVLDQLLAVVRENSPGRDDRIRWINEVRPQAPNKPSHADSAITGEEVTHAVRGLLSDRSIVVMESPTGSRYVSSILRLSRPGTFFTSGGSSLGWGVNAAIGVKLANPGAEVIALVGDGCYHYAVPSSSYWTASTYRTPFLTVVLNNGGWQSPKYSADLVHPDGPAKRSDRYWSTATANAKHAEIAAASGGAAAFTVKDRQALAPALREAMEVVRNGRCAVVDVAITRFSAQQLG